MNFKLIFAAAAMLATQSFAIAGIGFHYSPNVGTTLNEAGRSDFEGYEGKLGFSHGNFDYIQGFGFKAWVDILPFIDIEGTFNIQFASYNASLWVGEDTEIPLEIELGGTPFAKATPKYVAMNADLSVNYPFDIPLLPITPYVGAGITMHLNTFVLNKSFVDKALTKLKAENENLPIDDPEEIAKKLAREVTELATDEGLNKSIGFHILAGVRAKLPIIPIAAYANVKCYIGGDYDADIDPGHFAFELGGGFAL
jgi:hypothetical protein